MRYACYFVGMHDGSVATVVEEERLPFGIDLCALYFEWDMLPLVVIPRFLVFVFTLTYQCNES